MFQIKFLGKQPKIIILGVGILLLIAIGGTGYYFWAESNAGYPSQNEGQAEKLLNQSKIIEKRIGEEVQLATIKIKVNSVKERQTISSSIWTPKVAKEGTKFVVINLDITNTTDAPFYFSNSRGFAIVDDKGRMFSEYENVIGSIDNYFEQRKLSPSIKENGYFVYEIPNDSVNYGLYIGKAGTDETYKIILELDRETQPSTQSPSNQLSQTDSTPKQETPSLPKSEVVPPAPVATTPTKIDGLVSIRKGGGIWENWDADAEKDGLIIDVVYLDGQGEIISSDATRKMQITADVKLFATDTSDYPYKKGRLVFSASYSKSQIILGGIYPRIRVPKEEISVNPDIDYQFGYATITIHTPEQGDFSDEDNLGFTPLYE